MQTHKTGWPEFTGFIIATLLTLILQSLFTIPRMLLVLVGMELLWNQNSSPEPIQMILFNVLDFVFALFVGRLAMSGTRFIVKGADMPSVFLLSAWVILPLSLLTMIPNNIPGMFIPPAHDLYAALPGWMIGFYFSCHKKTEPHPGSGKTSAIAAATLLVAVILALSPVHRHGPMNGLNRAFMPHVSATFHPVPQDAPVPPADNNKMPVFTPAPPSGGNNQMPEFTHVPPQALPAPSQQQ